MGLHTEDFFGDYLDRRQSDSLTFIRSMLSIALVDGSPTISIPREYAGTMLTVLTHEILRRGRDQNPKGRNEVRPAKPVRARAPTRGTAHNGIKNSLDINPYKVVPANDRKKQ